MTTSESPKKSGYQPANWEDKLYQLWLDSGFFNPDVALEKGVADTHKPPFSIVLPPPNATGTLHVGHAAMLAIEDAFVRFARMQGRPTLWLPGTDHAAIATQSKVEKNLYQETGESRYDIGREALLEKIHSFVEQSRSTIVHQTKKMGSSLDWSREAFTLDEKRHQSVYVAFKKMYDDGIIYRGERIVNWDPKGQTTISDDEIVYKEETTKFYYFQYGPFVIGTARPETKLGDKYVVMHPTDERYAEYQHGQQIELEWVTGPITATVIKDAAIDPEFGTGVMTITPWHSAIDFEIAERHNLLKEQIIDLEGKLVPSTGSFSGLTIKEAREKIVETLKEKGLLVKTEDTYVHQIATAERTGEIIEPQIMRQWFVGVERPFVKNGKTTTLKELMQTAIKSRGGDITVLPERFEKNYFHWIDNLKDWCISRQIWYGHQIPVWYKGEEVFCDTVPPSGEGWTQDPDTLDTWFSSGTWTFSTLGWGHDEELWKKQRMYHPTTLIESGYDILFPWIARMILMSTYLIDESPFETIYLHGLVRDDEGRKMSKSLDNILDPLDVISQYGTDALRLALTSGTTPGNDMRIGEEKLTSSRNFVNKLWNISRYIQLQENTHQEIVLTTPADHFIVSRFETAKQAATQHLNQYNLSLAIETLQRFTIDDFADWYVEIHKHEKNTSLLGALFQELIALWHPFIPFVTEAIQQEIFNPEEILMVRSWPQENSLPKSDTAAAQEFEKGMSLISDIRVIRGEYKINPSLVLSVNLPELVNDSDFQSLFALGKIQVGPGTGIIIPVGKGNFSGNLFLGNSIDTTKERARIQKELTEAERYLSAMQAKLTNEGFLAKAGPMLKASTENLVRVTENRIVALKKSLNQLQ